MAASEPAKTPSFRAPAAGDAMNPAIAGAILGTVASLPTEIGELIASFSSLCWQHWDPELIDVTGLSLSCKKHDATAFLDVPIPRGALVRFGVKVTRVGGHDTHIALGMSSNPSSYPFDHAIQYPTSAHGDNWGIRIDCCDQKTYGSGVANIRVPEGVPPFGQGATVEMVFDLRPRRLPTPEERPDTEREPWDENGQPALCPDTLPKATEPYVVLSQLYVNGAALPRACLHTTVSSNTFWLGCSFDQYHDAEVQLHSLVILEPSPGKAVSVADLFADRGVYD